MSTMPQPRAGLLGQWDRFVGPGMTSGELRLVLGSAFCGAGAVAAYLAVAGFGPLHVLIGAVVALDVIGGAVCNMTKTTARWYHRAGQTASDHMGFIFLHLFHIGLVAWAFRGPEFDVAYLALMGGWLIFAALLIVRAPRVLRSPFAAALFLGGVALSIYATGPTIGLEWFETALFLKLLVGHLVPLAEDGPAEG